MNIFGVVGAFSVSALVLVWAKSVSLINETLLAFFAVILVLAGIIFPFYSYLIDGLKNDGEKTGDAEAIDKAMKAIAEASKALEDRKKE